MTFSIFELLYVGLAAGFVGLVVLGHALLFSAIYKCVREDWAVGRRSDRKPPLPDGASKPSLCDGLTQLSEHIRAAHQSAKFLRM